MLCNVFHRNTWKVLSKSLFCIDLQIFSSEGRTPKVSSVAYHVISNIMSSPLLYFRCFCLHIPLYARAWDNSESCAPVRLSFGSILRSSSSGIIFTTPSLANTLAFLFPFILQCLLIHWNVVGAVLILRAATITLNISL